MVFYKSIAIICFLFSNIYCLKIPERIHKSFIKHHDSTIVSIFPNIYKYLDSKSKKIDYNQNEMINTYKSIKNFKAGIVSKNNPLSFEKSISSFLKMNTFELKKMSINANKCFNQNFNISVNIKILEKLLT